MISWLVDFFWAAFMYSLLWMFEVFEFIVQPDAFISKVKKDALSEWRGLLLAEELLLIIHTVTYLPCNLSAPS